jgi:hypothetical protein
MVLRVITLLAFIWHIIFNETIKVGVMIIVGSRRGVEVPCWVAVVMPCRPVPTTRWRASIVECAIGHRNQVTDTLVISDASARIAVIRPTIQPVLVPTADAPAVFQFPEALRTTAHSVRCIVDWTPTSEIHEGLETSPERFAHGTIFLHLLCLVFTCVLVGLNILVVWQKFSSADEQPDHLP